MAGEPTSISWEDLHRMFVEVPQKESNLHRSYTLTADSESQATRDWPDFDATDKASRPVLPDGARLAVQHALISSIEEIRNNYKMTIFEVFYSEEGRGNLKEIARKNSKHDTRFYYIQQLIKEIINKVQGKNSECTYSEAIDMWQGKCPALRNLDLPKPEDLRLEEKESGPIAETIRNKYIPTVDEAMESIESALYNKLEKGPLALMKKALADLESY